MIQSFSPEALESASHTGGSLLVVDDEVEVTKALYRQFRRRYDVYTATSAVAGYEIMAQVPIQVVISDQRMPEITGAEFFQRLRGDYPDAIRLLLTGYADIEAVIAAINDGNVFRYITKPWDPAELDAVVAQAFERYRLIAENRRLVRELQETNVRLEERVRQRTAELAETNEQLRQMHREKDAFIGVVAHDLRNPVASIYTASYFLLDPRYGIEAEEQEQILLDIRGQAEYMIGLINDLLDVSQIESGELTLRLEEIDLRDFLQATVRRHGKLATRKGSRVILAAMPGGTVRGDPLRLRQVLDNLLDNAVKFSPHGSTVRVEADREPDGWRIRVIDQGPGISEDDRAQLFEYFGRSSARPTGDEGSTGLGLAITRRVVEAHGGEIGVESVPGEGATFWFTLPDDEA